MAAKPGEETPTITGSSSDAAMTRREKPMASAVSSLAASPITPRMVRPVTPQPR